MSRRILTEAEGLAYQAMAIAARQLKEAQRQANLARNKVVVDKGEIVTNRQILDGLESIRAGMSPDDNQDDLEAIDAAIGMYRRLSGKIRTDKQQPLSKPKKAADGPA